MAGPVQKACTQDLRRVYGVGNALGSGAGGVDNGFSDCVQPFQLGRGIAGIEAGENLSAPLTSEKPIRMLFLQPVGLVTAADGVDPFRPFGKEARFHGKGTEYIDDHGGAGGGFGTVQQL